MMLVLICADRSPPSTCACCDRRPEHERQATPRRHAPRLPRPRTQGGSPPGRRLPPRPKARLRVGFYLLVCWSRSRSRCSPSTGSCAPRWRQTPRSPGTEAQRPAPLAPHFAAYSNDFSQQHFLTPLLNSAIVALGRHRVTIVVASMAGYALARLPIRGAGAILAFILIAGFFPVLAMVGPLFLLFKELSLLDNIYPLIIVYLVYTLPIATWLLRNFFAQIPRSSRRRRWSMAPPGCRRCARSSSRLRCPGCSPPHPLLHPGLERLHLRRLVPRDPGSLHRAAGDRELRTEPVSGLLQPHRRRRRDHHDPDRACSCCSPSGASSRADGGVLPMSAPAARDIG